jgi:hypothetical protein
MHRTFKRQAIKPVRATCTAQVDQQIGLEETDDGIWVIHFNTVVLVTFDERDYIITG